MKKFFGEFKKFITRGNILDLAVGIIVGGAFTAIVTALTNNIIRPLINWLIVLIGGKEGLTSVYTFLSKAYTAEGAIDLANSIYIDWGAFIASILDFVIIAFTVFLIIKIVNTSREKLREMAEDIEEMSSKEFKAKRKELRLKAKKEKRSFYSVWKEYEKEKEEQEKVKAEQIAKEKAEREAQERLNNPTEQDLLKEIRDLLKEKSSK